MFVARREPESVSEIRYKQSEFCNDSVVTEKNNITSPWPRPRARKHPRHSQQNRKNIRRRGFQEFRNKSLRSCKILRLQNFREKEVKSELLTDESLAVFGDFIFHFFVQQRENVQQKII